MLKFKSITGFRTGAAKLPAAKDGEPIYLCVHFTNDIGHGVHKAVVTAEELAENFKGHCWGVTITGYMTQDEVKNLTLEQRGLPPEAPLVKPETVPSPIWHDLNEGQKLWLIEHERLHEDMRRKATKATNDAADAVQAAYLALTDITL